MKTLALSVFAIAAMVLIALQHQQLGQLRAENMSLQQASAEADRLKADLARSTAIQADTEDDIARLREENLDLLKLRNQVNQLREATAQFEQVRAENLRLQSVSRNAPSRDNKEAVFQPIVVLVQNLYDQGLSTPEAAVQTFLWAERDRNADALSKCILPEHWSNIIFRYGSIKNIENNMRQRQKMDSGISIEIVARRDIDPNTVQLGIQSSSSKDLNWEKKIVFTLKFRDGEWKLDVDDFHI